MKIGIIGAENSHAANIARTINIEKKIKGFTVDYIWGETQAFARKTAEAGRIPNIVKKQSEMMGKIDALVVDHRHGKYHLAAALPFVKAGIPTFVDKPFCYRAAEGKAFLRVVRKCGTPVSSFSSIPNRKSVAQFAKKVAALGDLVAGATYGPADIKSPHGGVFFYGTHQVEAALKIFGCDVKWVVATKSGDNAAAQMSYANGMLVTVNFIKDGCREFYATAAGKGEVIHQPLTADKGRHLPNMRLFTAMFRTGKEPKTDEQMLRPIQVLEAIEKGLRSGKREKVVW